MVRKLPSLNALKAFEAAARHQSFVKAASELNVTHAAISRHVRELETSLRTALFERTGRGVLLTDAGAGLARELTRGLDVIAMAVQRFGRVSRAPRRRLSVTSDVLFAMQWLVPRLGAFTAQHPHVEIILDPTPRLVDFAKEDVDLGIRYGAGSWRGVDAEKLADATLIAVCSPSLLKARRISSPKQLPPELLIQGHDRGDWRIWLEAAGVAAHIEARGPTLLADLAMAAAEAGQGFALADRIVAADALRAGRLLSPFPIEVPQKAYYIVSPEGRRASISARGFRAWLKQQAAFTLG